MTDAVLHPSLWPDAEPARRDMPVSAATSAAATRRNWIAVACAQHARRGCATPGAGGPRRRGRPEGGRRGRGAARAPPPPPPPPRGLGGVRPVRFFFPRAAGWGGAPVWVGGGGPPPLPPPPPAVGPAP